MRAENVVIYHISSYCYKFITAYICSKIALVFNYKVLYSE